MHLLKDVQRKWARERRNKKMSKQSSGEGMENGGEERGGAELLFTLELFDLYYKGSKAGRLARSSDLLIS